MTRTGHKSVFAAGIAGLGMAVLLATPTTSHAQEYFGRNKVQYRTFDFQVLKTEHFDVYYYAEEEAAARDASRMAERWYARLSTILEHQFEKRQPLILYANHPHFQQTTALSGEISDGTGGVTEAYKQRVILPFAHSYEETDHVLGHELVHAFQYDISGLGRAGAGIEQAAQRFNLPGWFMEGMAEYLSVGPRDALTANWLRNAALSGDIPTIDRLTRDPNIFPYRYGQALWAYIGGRWGDPAIGQILGLTAQGMPFEEAFVRILNITSDELSEEWAAAIRRAYLPMLSERWEARQVASALMTEEHGGGRMNLSPSLSPDGKWVAFLSELNFLDVELHLANVETGEVVRTLQKGAAFDSHVSSLRFINSAGTWSPDAKQFALGAQAGGEDVVIILDVEKADRVRQYDLNGLGEVSTPTWSPDGKTIVFSALNGGWSDLYKLDLASGATTRITNDRFADLHPTFSPDGRTVAFVTDRFGTNVETLVYGGYELATLDFTSGRIEPVTTMGASHNINPQWNADGSSLYYISNCTGIPNVYRVAMGAGASEYPEISQVTNLFSGVSGITDTSPAFSLSRNGETMVITAFEDNGYNLYTLKDKATLEGKPVERVDCGPAAAAASLLPPNPRPVEPAFNRVAMAIANDSIGLPTSTAATAYGVDRYRPRLGLDYLGQPQLSISSGGVFGGLGLYGGISGIFSDILGRHTVAGALQMQGGIAETGGALQYLNSKGRLNWGLGVQRLPYVYGYYGAGTARNQLQLIRIRYFDSALQGYASYPISAVQRFEVGGGLRRISQDQQVFNLEVDRFGQVVDRQREDISAVGYNMVEGSAAWVYDSSVSAYTGPMAGSRARVELSPVLGQLSMVSGLADFRHYTFLRPFTLAFRGMHSGRYCRDSEGFFSDNFLGYPWLVRGYESAYNSCYNTGESCNTVNELVGSRILVGNAELRLPLLSPMPNALFNFGLPVDAIAFYDGGIAWGNGTRPRLQFGTPADANSRGILSSVGFGARVNLFGALIFEVDRVKAIDANNGWNWVIALQPGF